MKTTDWLQSHAPRGMRDPESSIGRK